LVCTDSSRPKLRTTFGLQFFQKLLRFYIALNKNDNVKGPFFDNYSIRRYICTVQDRYNCIFTKYTRIAAKLCQKVSGVYMITYPMNAAGKEKHINQQVQAV
jgi:hypothetical protein